MSITDERLAELIKIHDGRWIFDGQSDTAAALRELQQLRAQHREIICKRCLLREQLGQSISVDF